MSGIRKQYMDEAHHSGEIRISELEKPENARWLALLFDTEGAVGWVRYTESRDRIDEKYRYVYVYRSPYIGVSMKKLESKKTVDEAGRLIGVHAYTKDGKRETYAVGGRAFSALQYMKPHFDKNRRLSNLILILFKHHTYISIDNFDKVIETLFGRYMSARAVNSILLRMTEEEFGEFIKRAEGLTGLHLK